ncbi:MAG: proprotein convertase P-domain-containing protein [Sandaracinaceae bacterium]|nr:proprotein convertase P-domain-containing protein [Sandaracinaceae bacterium]
MRIHRRSLWLAALLALGGCTAEVPPELDDGDEPLSDVDALFQDAPADLGHGLPEDGKADETPPSTFDLMEYMSPVRSQGSRGTCTIFATVALMESLYIREGTLPNPDFSEQHLQWSVKTEVGAFTNTAGSNPNNNLQAIDRFGIVEESAWPYENSQWNTSNDPMCTGDAQPVRCYTNGDPPEAARNAMRWHLPRGRWINPSVRSLQGHMLSTRTPVVVSADFFYQAWNHGRSTLRTNSEYKRNGYVLAPNEADIADSSGDRRAGHGFILLGWDDNLSVPIVDGEGNQVLDADGNPTMETGFFLFKNSWGTSSFGTANPHGAGYGWIAYRYITERATAYVAGLPEVMLAEVCNDATDNDRDGLADCDDPDCASERACLDPGDNLVNDTSYPIPDNSSSGVVSQIVVTEPGQISSLAVTVDITHTYRGDLSVYLVRGADRVVMFDRQGGSADDLQETFTVSDFNGTDAAGTYELVVVDNANQDTGTLNLWSLDITRCDTDCGGTTTSRTYPGDTGLDIPDGSSLESTITVPDMGAIESLHADVEITHSFPYELTIRLRHEGGREFVLLTEDASSETGVSRSFEVPGFVGDDIGGSWTLTVVDAATGDTGTLVSWQLRASTR